MVYVVTDSKEGGKILLVKAKSKEEVEERLVITDEMKVCVGFTDNEIAVMSSASFAVISV